MSQTQNQTATPTIDDVLNETNVFEFEKYRQDLVQADSELKICIDKVFDLRVQAAELEASLTSFYCPVLQAKLRICHELAAKCEEHTRRTCQPEIAALQTDALTTETNEAPTDTAATAANETAVDDAIMEVDLTLPN